MASNFYSRISPQPPKWQGPPSQMSWASGAGAGVGAGAGFGTAAPAAPAPPAPSNPHPATTPSNPNWASSAGEQAGAGAVMNQPHPWQSNATAGAANTFGPGAASSQPTAAPPTQPSQEGVLSGAGYGEDWYKTYGQDLMTPSASERLFDAGMSASNPFYDHAEKMVTKSINDAAAARGGFNSSHTMNQIGTAVSDLRGQQAHEMGERASASDRARTDRYGSSFGFADRAQDQTQRRVGQATNAYTDLARDQANNVRNFYGEAGRGMGEANMAAIEAQLKASGLDAAQVSNIINTLGGLGGAAIRAFG